MYTSPAVKQFYFLGGILWSEIRSKAGTHLYSCAWGLTDGAVLNARWKAFRDERLAAFSSNTKTFQAVLLRLLGATVPSYSRVPKTKPAGENYFCRHAWSINKNELYFNIGVSTFSRWILWLTQDMRLIFTSSRRHTLVVIRVPWPHCTPMAGKSLL